MQNLSNAICWSFSTDVSWKSYDMIQIFHVKINFVPKALVEVCDKLLLDDNCRSGDAYDIKNICCGCFISVFILCNWRSHIYYELENSHFEIAKVGWHTWEKLFHDADYKSIWWKTVTQVNHDWSSRLTSNIEACVLIQRCCTHQLLNGNLLQRASKRKIAGIVGPLYVSSYEKMVMD